jgi:hypothetical protein
VSPIDVYRELSRLDELVAERQVHYLGDRSTGVDQSHPRCGRRLPILSLCLTDSLRHLRPIVGIHASVQLLTCARMFHTLSDLYFG